MTEKKTHPLLLPILLWLLAMFFLRVIVHYHRNTILWDMAVYRDAILSLRAGHDPYADGVARQIFMFHHPETRHSFYPPFSYPYSPITIPIVRWIARFPLAITGKIYVLLCAIGIALPIWVCLQIPHRQERRIALLLAPLVLFFPGLIFNSVIFSGNIAYPIYGLLMPAALLGWRRQRWLLFYIAVILAALVKGPLLVLVAVPVLSARRQWLPAIYTAVVSCGIYALQPLIWPALVRSYLTAVELQFSINRDFGPSPAGELAYKLFDVIPYRVTLIAAYLVYAIPVVLLLLYLRRRFLAGYFSLRDWIPILMLGVVLINPRSMEYDIAPITVLMGLALWRIARHYFSRNRAIAVLLIFLIAINVRQVMLIPSWILLGWRPFEGAILLLLFFLGARLLLTLPAPNEPHLPLTL